MIIEDLAMLRLGKLLAATALLGSVTLSPHVQAEGDVKAPPVLYPVPEFTLTDQNAKPVSLSTLRGKLWIADFIYASCKDECPLMTSKLQRVQRELKDLTNVTLVSVTTDPKRDTPKALKNYVAQHKIDDANWLFLTGDKHQIVELAMKGFKLPADQKSVTHSAKFVVIDQSGNVRAYYESGDAVDLKRLVSDVRLLTR